jgi:hypothetical protein
METPSKIQKSWQVYQDLNFIVDSIYDLVRGLLFVRNHGNEIDYEGVTRSSNQKV